MKKTIAAALALLLALALAAAAPAEGLNAGIWAFAYYLDEFRMPTEEPYLRTAVPIEGLFTGSGEVDAPLSALLVVDANGLSILLYEHGDALVKNATEADRAYAVTTRDADGARARYGARMPAGADRLRFEAADGQAIRAALRESPAFSFYIEAEDDPGNNYLFTIEDTSGFAEVDDALQAVFDERSYQAAVTMYEVGGYEQALAAFAALGDYKDSAEWPERYAALMYDKGISLWIEGDFAQAAAAFARAGDYSDAAEQVKASWYAQGEALLAKGDYAGANQAFIDAGDYNDAASRVGQPFYLQGEALLDEGDYAGANQAFIDAGDFSDASSRVGQPFYIEAEALLAQGDYEAANQAFIDAGDYRDAADRVGEAFYARGRALRDAGMYEAAVEAFAAAGNYKDAAAQIQATWYAQGIVLEAAGEREAALQAYEQAGDYMLARSKAEALRASLETGEVPEADAAPAEAASAAPEPVQASAIDGEALARGASGKEVTRLQKALAKLGFFKGSADGRFGKSTEKAVMQAQAALHLEQTGIADGAFLKLIYGE